MDDPVILFNFLCRVVDVIATMIVGYIEIVLTLDGTGSRGVSSLGMFLIKTDYVENLQLVLFWLGYSRDYNIL